MAPDVKTVRHVRDYQLELTFADGVRAELDLRSHVIGKGGVFEALEDPAFFSRVWVNDDIGTIVWPNDADLSPEFLYQLATGKQPRLMTG